MTDQIIMRDAEVTNAIIRINDGIVTGCTFRNCDIRPDSWYLRRAALAAASTSEHPND